MAPVSWRVESPDGPISAEAPRGVLLWILRACAARRRSQRCRTPATTACPSKIGRPVQALSLVAIATVVAFRNMCTVVIAIIECARPCNNHKSQHVGQWQSHCSSWRVCADETNVLQQSLIPSRTVVCVCVCACVCVCVCVLVIVSPRTNSRQTTVRNSQVDVF